MNKQFGAIILGASFLALAGFGFLLMHESADGHGNFCAASWSGAAFCPGGGALAWANFHLQAFRNFSTLLPIAAAIALSFVIVVYLLRKLFSVDHLLAALSIYSTPAELPPVSFSATETGRWLIINQRELPALAA